MKRKKVLHIERLRELCKGLRDRRREWGNKRHELVDVLILALVAVICGCEGWDEIRDYGQTKEEWLRTFLTLPNGIPSESTFRRVINMIEPEALEGVYREWVRPYVGSCCGKQGCIDGKSVRGVGRRSGENLHMVSMWIQEDQITLGQVKTQEKSNEITAIPELIQSLDIYGSVITIDAMGCQRDITRVIREKEAHYILAVKDNQQNLADEIREYFDWAIDDPIEQKCLDQHKETTFDHGRTTKWHVYSTKNTVWFESSDDWAGLTSFVMVECRHKTEDKETVERRYYISSLDADAKYFHQRIRAHWHVENKLHWMLDVAFNEDHCTIHKGNAPENLSLLRKMALTMLRQDTSHHAGIARKRKLAGWNNDYALSIISIDV